MSKKEILNCDKDYFYELLGKLPQAETGLEFRSLIILPTGLLHESGYGVMYFVLLDDNNKPIAKVTRGTDVLMVWKKPSDWHIDCLPCGLLRVFHFGRRTNVVGNTGNNFEITPGRFDKGMNEDCLG